MRLKIFYPLIALFLFVTTGCDDSLLDIENTNNPDFDAVNATITGESLESKASAMYRTFFLVNHHSSGMQAILSTSSDLVTASHGNFGMRDVSSEPRNGSWNNDPTYSNAGQLNFVYANTYSNIQGAMEIINAIDNGVQAGPNGSDNPRLQAFSYFILGISHATLSLIYDKAFVVGPGITLEGNLESTSHYNDVAAAAVGYLDKAIEITNANSFTIPGDWMGSNDPISSSDFVRIANSYAARTLSYVPRNKADVSKVDWNRVKTYADNGIVSDIVVQLNANGSWHANGVAYLANEPGWGQTDMYVIHLMDPNQPQYWEDTPSFPHPPASVNPPDKRLLTDFIYVASNTFRPERGYYHFSNYRYGRFIPSFTAHWAGLGPFSEMRAAENDMLRAEARLHLGDVAGAASIINAGTRKTRGELPDVAAEATAVRQAIHHERMVELYLTGLGVEFYEMRKLDYLQKGTPLHFPIPAAALQTMNVPEPFYTFGQVANADGINTSNGGWR